MKQFKITLSPGLRAKLDAASAASGRTVAEEMRQRIESTFAQDGDTEPHLRELLRMINLLAFLVKIDTQHDWFDHPAAFQVFHRAVDAYFGRLRGSPPLDAEQVFAPGELPKQQLIPSDHLATKGAGLEAIASFQLNPLEADQMMRKLRERVGDLNLPGPMSEDVALAGKKRSK
jgi:hypothetical protein